MQIVLLKRKGKGGQEQKEEAEEEQKDSKKQSWSVRAWLNDLKDSFKSTVNDAVDRFYANVSRVANRTMKGVTSLGIVLLVLGFIGLAVFGYELYQNGGINGAAQNLSDGIGLIVSIMLLVVGATVAESGKKSG